MKLHNTLGNQQQTLTPLQDNLITMYNCGLTVYSHPHIGNWVAYIYWDLLHRTLLASGYEVNRVQNITDVGHLTDDGDAGEDKMQKGALKEGKSAWDVAEKYINIADHEAFELLGLLRPTHMPRATEYIQQQIDFVRELEDKGYTYVINDGVYYDTTKFHDYGKMARLDIDGLEFGARVADTGKKNPTDFALWKFSPKNEKRDMEWDSPWGKGFPGWHLECSVMARELLGDQIDIHTGGIDHIPIHHTNEIAQTEAVTGIQFAQIWVHANHLKVDGTKISKSLGNGYTLQDIINKGYSLEAFKLLVLSKHYSTEGNFSWEILEAANNRLTRWRAIAALRHQIHDTLVDDDEKDSTNTVNGVLLAALHAALEKLQSDLNSPEAIAIIEQAFDRVESADPAKVQSASLVALLEWIKESFGIDLLTSTPDIPDKAKQAILRRRTARNNKDWTESDQIRDELMNEYKITLLDNEHATIWRYKS
jgi:cysteinyl-tRNA synthetase